MKKILKRTIAVIMVVLITLTSAPLGSLMKMDFGKFFITEVQAASNYPGISLNVPWFSMRHKSGCGISAVAMVEAYEKGYDNNDVTAYNAVYNYNGKKVYLESYAKLGYNLISNSLEKIYNELKKGNPVIVYRTGGSQGNHFSVIYEYSGSSTKLEKSGFKLLNTYHPGEKDFTVTNKISKKDFSSWLGNSTWKNTLVRVSNKVPLTDLTTPEGRVFKFLTKKVGLNSAAAIGFMANIKAESNFNPKCTYDEGGFYSFGLCQWNRGRKTNLERICKANGLDPKSIEGQLSFIKYELEHNYKTAVLNNLKSVSNDLNGAKKAAEIVCRKYEIPANIDAQVKKRQGYADTYWKTYGTGVSNSTTQSVVSTPAIATTSCYGGVEVKLSSSTSGATIYYTTNGSNPTISSTKYTSAFKIKSTSTIKAVAIKSGMTNSGIKSSKITVGTVEKPEISLSMGESYTNVTISTNTKNSVIYYTTDGTVPTASSNKYEGVLQISENATIKAIAVKKGCADSAISDKTIAVEAPATPSVKLEGKENVATNAVVNVSWSNIVSATNYTVSLCNSDGNEISQIKTGALGASFDVKELVLKPGTYTIKVKAENYIGSSAESSVAFTVKPDVTVKFVSDDTILLQQLLPYGSSASYPIAPQKVGHNFIEWSVKASKLNNITTDLTVEAVFEPKTYKVTLVYNENSYVQTVEYGKAVALPDDVVLPTADYKVESWSVEKTTGGYDVNFVDGDMTIKPVFALINPNLPITINDLSVLYNSSEDAYNFCVELTNGTDKLVSNATMIAVLKTSKGKTVATSKLDLANITANATLTKDVAVNSSVNASLAEVYIVTYIDGVTGGAISNVKSAEVKAENGIYYSEWSEFSTTVPEKVENREIVSKVQYSYQDKETTTSTNAALSGWTKKGSSISYGSWGSWSGWSTTKQTSSETKEVQTRTVYYYRHYCDGKGNIAPSTGYTNAKYGPHEIYSTTKYKNDRYSSSTGYYIADGHTKCAKGGTSYYYIGTKTQYRYRTRSAVNIYSYERWGAQSQWIDDVIQENATRLVTTRTVYSFRDMLKTGNDSIVEGENAAGTEMTVTGKLDADSDYSGKTATVMVYKTYNADALEDQIMSISQIKIGDNNSYSYTFIPKEELSKDTGDFVVALSVEGAQKRINVDTIKVPVSTYVVDFVMKNTDGTNKTCSVTVNEGDDAESPTDIPKIEGYVFTGWDKRFTNVTTNITVTAKYEEENVAVAFVDWENKKIIELNTTDYKYGDTLILPMDTLTAEGKIFKGWSYAEGTEIAGNLIVEAVYESIEYTVTFLDADGNVHLEQKVPYGYAAELPEPITKEGYIFLGWSNDSCWWNVKSDVTVKPIMTFSEKTEVVQSDAEEGKYTNGVSVKLESSTEDARIFYTMDGSDPEINITDGEVRCGEATIEFIPEENETIWLEETTNIKAQSYRDGEALSECSEFIYEVEIEEIEDLSITSVSYSTPAAYYKVFETAASLCMVVNNPYGDELSGYGYSICNTVTKETYGYDSFFEDGTNTKSIGKVFSVTGLTPGITYTYRFYAVVGGEMYESEEGSFTTLNCKTHSYTSKVTKGATCTSTGIKTFTCSCGDTYTETIAKLTHTYKSVTSKATLSKNGKVENKCCVCGLVKSTTTIYYPKTIKLSNTSYTYNGMVLTPSVTVKDSKGNTLKKDTDYTVKYESGRKAIGEYTVIVTFKGKYSGTKKLTYTIAPKATSKITASQTTTTITLKWNKVTGADGYRVYQYNTKTKKYEKLKDVTKTTLKISKLKTGTVYKYKVRAYTKDDDIIFGAYSKEFETATKCKTPSIKKISSTKGKASFTWSNVSGESGYQVYYSTKKGGSYKKHASYKTNVVKGSKKKLKSKKTYYFKVRTYTKTGSGTIYSAWSKVKSIKIK